MPDKVPVSLTTGTYQGCNLRRRVYHILDFNNHKCKNERVAGGGRAIRSKPLGYQERMDRMQFLVSLWESFGEAFALTLRNKPGMAQDIRWQDGIDFADFFEAKTGRAYEKDLRRSLASERSKAKMRSRSEGFTKEKQQSKRQQGLKLC